MKHLKRRRMRVLQEQFPLRKEIEQCVYAHDKNLREEVRYMSLFVLLCNCHPLYRENYAQKLYKMGKLSTKEASEFFKITTMKEL